MSSTLCSAILEESYDVIRSSSHVHTTQITPDETFSFGPIQYARFGRFIHAKKEVDEQDHAKLQQEIVQSIPRLEAKIDASISDLTEQLRKYDPFDVIGQILFMNTMKDPETYKEYEHIEGINNVIQCLFTDTVWLMIARSVRDKLKGSDAVKEELRFKTLSNSLYVRYSSYQQHLEELLLSLFSDFSPLQKVLGFTIQQAINISKTIVLVCNARFADKVELASSGAQKMHATLKTLRRKKGKKKIVDGMWKHLLSLKPSEAKAKIDNMSMAFIFYCFGDSLLFSVDDIARVSKCDNRIVHSFLECVSLSFGDVDKRYSRPSPTHPLNSKSVIKINGEYFCPIAQYILYNLRHLIESLLNPATSNGISTTQPVWDKYISHRGKLLENMSVALLADTLKSNERYVGIKYGQDGELDGLILFDSYLILIETKSGTFTNEARRGAPSGMIENLDELVGYGRRQLERARQYINSTDIPTFVLESGISLALDKKQYTNIVEIIVTLEQLDCFTTTLYQLERFGIVNRVDNHDHPWVLSFADLRVICEHIDISSQLIHYILRRRRVNDIAKITAHDELDWFGHYLLEGLYFEDMFDSDEAPDMVNLLSYTTNFDEYYMHESGQRKTPAKKLQQAMPDTYKRLLQKLDADRMRGFAAISLFLLDMSFDARKQLADGIEIIIKRTKKDEMRHDFTLGFNDLSTGITIMTFPEAKVSPSIDYLKHYCTLKKYQLKYDNYIGIVYCVNRTSQVHVVIYSPQKWQYESDMEVAVESFFKPK